MNVYDAITEMVDKVARKHANAKELAIRAELVELFQVAIETDLLDQQDGASNCLPDRYREWINTASLANKAVEALTLRLTRVETGQ